MQIGLFVDVSNLYHRSRCTYKKKLDYKKYLDFVKLMGETTIMRAYGSCEKDSASSFIAALKHIGYETIFKQTKVLSGGKRKGDVDSLMIVDIMKHMDEFDTLVLGSADADFLPVVKECIAKGKKVIILACSISSAYEGLASILEVHEGLMEDE